MEPKRCMIFSGTFRCFNPELFNKLVIQDKNIELICSLNTPPCDGTIPPPLTYYNPYQLPESWTFVNKTEKWNNYNTCSMFYHNMMAFERASALQPDIIIKFRSDIRPASEFPYFECAPNTIYHPNCNIWSGINDQVAVGDYESMRKYCDLYNHLEDYVKELKIPFHPETLLLFHLQKSGLTIKTFEFNYELDGNRTYKH